LKQRRRVLFPQPEGPMIAVTSLAWTSMLTLATAFMEP
jgi:hypothetical protein